MAHRWQRWVVFTILGTMILGVPASASAQAGKDRLEESVERGLAFLALMQEKDGSWHGNNLQRPAVTALAVMAFLSVGHVPGEGPYRANVEKGIRWVLTQEQPSGLFCASGSWEELYQHGICTLMLAEVVGMTDAKLAGEIRPKLAKAVKLLLQGQRTEDNLHKGGWRYRLDSTDADISVSGWQILALRSARNLGCDVPAERMDLAMEFILRCRDPQAGGFCYTPGAPPSSACTGTSILALELCGKERHHSRETLHGGSYLIKTPLHYEDKYFFYTAYYAAQAMFQLGNNYWNIYRPRLHRELLDHQERNGGWVNKDPTGTSYNTAMAILALTVEYRYLPIYQRDESA